MDVKYIPADWDRMKDGLGDLIGLGRWGKGMIDGLKNITENLEDAESDIAKYDRDGVISFSHIDREGKYQSLFEDFKVLHDFSGKVGDIVDRTIDEPFYEDLDKFVTSMRDATISNYTTKNRIDATEQQVIYQRYGMQETREVPKAEVSLDDLLSGDNFYAEQLQLEYDMWKAQHPDQDFTQEEYRMAAVNMNAFEYESIKDRQHNKEFWANIGALAAVVGATVLAVVVPPVGIPLALTVGTAYGTMELGTAVTGKDWASGRELNTGERWLRGALSPLDIIPGVSGIKKFSSGVRMANQAANLGRFGLKAGVKTGMQQELRYVGDRVTTAGRQSTARLKSAGAALKDRAIRDAISAGKAADSMVTSAKNIASPRRVVSMNELGNVHIPAENTRFFENKIKDTLTKADGVRVSSGARGTGNTSIKIKEISEVNYGDHFTKGKRGRKELTPNVRYVTEDGYKYTTDELGRITDVEADNLILQEADRNLGMQRAVGREDRLPDDDGGHLIGSQFHGSGDIDNLVAQNSQINRSGGQWYKMETEWANALKETPPRKVSVKIEPIYIETSMRPDSFEIMYEIEGKGIFEKIIKNKSGG